MKIGLLAYSSQTGLGIQTHNFFSHMSPSKVLAVDLSFSNRMSVDHSRFSGCRVARGYPTDADMEWLADGVDLVFLCENPLNYHLYQACRERGVRVVSQYNYEFLDYFLHPDWLRPSVLAAPTEWGIDRVRNLGVAPVVRLPVPVDRELHRFRRIEKLETFVHVIGRPTAQDRNGTMAFLSAARAIGPEYRYKVFYQSPGDERAQEYFFPVAQALLECGDIVEVIADTPDHTELFESGDVLVLPRKYGGLCLPVNEALSCGMPVVMPNISPNNGWLPNDWLCRAFGVGIFEGRAWVDVFEADVDSLVEVMLRFGDDGFMSEANLVADSIADSISWDRLKPVYEDCLERVCQGDV